MEMLSSAIPKYYYRTRFTGILVRRARFSELVKYNRPNSDVNWLDGDHGGAWQSKDSISCLSQNRQIRYLTSIFFVLFGSY